ncbi:MAG: helix-turn-helix domain-containing protein [Alphaproteobacteria bacterium]
MERKRALEGSARKAVRETVCAFANDLAGTAETGVVFIGVQDDGTPLGTPITDQVLLQLSGIKTEGDIVPPPAIMVEKRRLQGQDVAVVMVQPSDSPPVRFQRNILVRNGRRQSVATAQEERILNERRRTARFNRPFDLEPVPGLRLDALNIRQFEEEYCPRAFSPEVLEANDRTIEQRLAATKMIGDYILG